MKRTVTTNLILSKELKLKRNRVFNKMGYLKVPKKVPKKDIRYTDIEDDW